MKAKNRPLAIFLLFAVLVLLNSCAVMDNDRENSDGELISDRQKLKSFFLEESDDVVVTDNTVIFTDDSGNGVCEIEKFPKSVVILNASLTTLWYEAGGEAAGCIKSTSTAQLYEEFIGRDITLDSGMSVVAESAAAKNWNIEGIISLQPSLIICSNSMNGYSTVKGAAQMAGIPIIVADYDDFSDYLKWFKVFANLSGHSELWESVALPVLGRVVDGITSLPRDEEVKVLAVFADSDSVAANTSNTVIGEMITLLGGKNIADDRATAAERIEINLEWVYAADPDVILVQCHTDTDTARRQMESIIEKNEVWSSLTAVREGRIYYLEKILFHSKPNSRFVDAYGILAEILYPSE